MITIIIFQGIIFIILIFVLRQFMKGHVTGAVGHLQKMNDELIKQQSELKQKISEADKEYQTKTMKLEQEIAARQAEIRQEANRTLEEARSRAMQERDRLINEAVETREKIRHEIMAEMEEKAIQHSKRLIAEFFTGEVRTQVHECLLEGVIEGLKEVDMTRFQIDTDMATIVSAKPLDATVKKQVQKILLEKIKKDVKFTEEVDEGLIGGMILRFGSFVIDGSLTNRLQESAAQLKKETARKYQGTG